jgi:hydroxymethylglutaryl-CoA synthase
VRGILAHGTHVPHRRLDRAEIAKVMGSGGGRGTRSVASFDEDTTTMGVAAARVALAVRPDLVPDAVWFATAEPAYLEKTNACAIHAALRLAPDTMAFDFGGAVRSGAGALRAALCGAGTTLVVSAGIRTGQPTGADESAGGDGAAALVVGDAAQGDLIAEYLGGSSLTEEFVDRWRVPGAAHARQWEERFGETRYVPLARTAWAAALADAGVDRVDLVGVVGSHPRAQARIAKDLGGAATVVDDLAATVGSTGAAHAGLVLSSILDTAEPGTTIAVVSVVDGVDVMVLRTTDALAAHRPARSTAAQIAHAGAVSYPTFLQWRGVLEVQPPNRPAPTRVSSSAAARRQDWKYGFVAGAGDESGLIHMPPARVSIRDDDHDDAQVPVPMADATGTIVTFTIDRLVYSLSPPVVFAVVDWDGGGRMPIELTDVDPATLAIGDRVEPTFRRLATADGIHNYFWKARPVPA